MKKIIRSSPIIHQANKASTSTSSNSSIPVQSSTSNSSLRLRVHPKVPSVQPIPLFKTQRHPRLDRGISNKAQRPLHKISPLKMRCHQDSQVGSPGAQARNHLSLTKGADNNHKTIIPQVREADHACKSFLNFLCYNLAYFYVEALLVESTFFNYHKNYINFNS